MFAAQLVLRRFIPPEDYGLFDWAQVLFLVLGAVRDLGLAYHVLRVEPRPFGNLLALEGLWGGFLMVAAIVVAPLAADLNAGDHAHTVGVIRLLAFFLFFEGLATVPRVYLEGELQVGKAVVPELLRNLCIVGTSGVLAVLGMGVWSLAIGHTAGAALYAALLWTRVRGQIPLAYQRGQTWSLLRESLPLATVWFLIIFTRYIDPLILGLRFSFDDIGQYTFAYYWATMISVQILLPAIGRVLFPALVKFGAHTAEMFRAFALSTIFVLSVEVSAALLLFLNADLVLLLLGGSQWVDAPSYLRILAFAPLVDPFSRLGGEVLKTLHWDRLWIIACLLTVSSFGIGGFVLTGTLGPIGMAWINLLPLGGLLMAWALYKVSPAGFRRLFRDLLWVYLVPLPFFAAAYLLAGDEAWWRLGLSIVAGASAFGITAWRFGSEFVAFFRAPPTDDLETA